MEQKFRYRGSPGPRSTPLPEFALKLQEQNKMGRKCSIGMPQGALWLPLPSRSEPIYKPREPSGRQHTTEWTVLSFRFFTPCCSFFISLSSSNLLSKLLYRLVPRIMTMGGTKDQRTDFFNAIGGDISFDLSVFKCRNWHTVFPLCLLFFFYISELDLTLKYWRKSFYCQTWNVTEW